MHDLFDAREEFLSSIALFAVCLLIIWEVGEGLAVLYERGRLVSWLWQTTIFWAVWMIGSIVIVVVASYIVVPIYMRIGGPKAWLERVENWLAARMKEVEESRQEESKNESREDWKRYRRYWEPGSRETREEPKREN